MFRLALEAQKGDSKSPGGSIVGAPQLRGHELHAVEEDAAHLRSSKSRKVSKLGGPRNREPIGDSEGCHLAISTH